MAEDPLCPDEGSLSFVTVIFVPIGTLRTNENVEGLMAEDPRLRRAAKAPKFASSYDL